MSLLGLQLYSVREELDDLPAVLTKVADLGLRQVEPHRAHAEPERYAAALTAAGLLAPSMHTRFVGEDADLQEEYFAAATRVGASTIVHPATDAQLWLDRGAVEEFAAALNASAQVAAELGLQVGYHHHGYELTAKIDGRPALEYFAELLAPQVALEVDIFWAAVAGVEPAGLIDRLAPRVSLLHLKDAVVPTGFVLDPELGHEGLPAQVPLGQGTINIDACIASAPSALRIIEFDSYAGDIWEGIAASIQYLEQ